MSENDIHQIHEIQLPGYHTKREFFLSQTYFIEMIYLLSI